MERTLEDKIYSILVNTYLYYRCKDSIETFNKLKELDYNVSILDKDELKFLLKVEGKEFIIKTSDKNGTFIKSIKQKEQ